MSRAPVRGAHLEDEQQDVPRVAALRRSVPAAAAAQGGLTRVPEPRRGPGGRKSRLLRVRPVKTDVGGGLATEREITK